VVKVDLGRLLVVIVGNGRRAGNDLVADGNLGRVDLEFVGVEGDGSAVLDDVETRTELAGSCVNKILFNALNGHRTLVCELLKVWLEGQVVVDRLDVGGQHLAGLGDVHMGVNVCARVSTHVAAVGAVSDGYEGRVSRGVS
jgi:hypothetical protein